MFKQPSTRRIQKRSFLLFELLVSMALISLCLFPLMKPLAAMRCADRCYLEDIQLEMAAQNAFCRIKENLFESSYNWNQLSSPVSGELPPFTIVISKNKKGTYQCSYTIKSPYKDVTKPKLKRAGRVISIAICLKSQSHEKPHHFDRTVYLEKQI